MKTKLLTLIAVFFTIVVSAQKTANVVNLQAKKQFQAKTNASPNSLPANNYNTSTGGQSDFYEQNVCGMNYVYGSVMTETRTKAYGFNTNGTGFPATISISGLPTSCSVILQAFLYYDASYTEATPPSTTATITNPALASATYASTITGTGPDKCWGETGTATWRTDVTSAISGNGTYTISLNGFANAAWEVDGCTLFIIYQAGPTTGTTGNLFIRSGDVTANSATGQNNANNFPPPATDWEIDSIGPFTVCNNSSIAQGWVIIADATDNPAAYTTNVETINAGHSALPTTATFNNLQWNFDLIPTSVTAGQTETTFYTYRNDDPTFSAAKPFDCYNFVMYGMYWQNTGCVDCLPVIATPTTGSGTLTHVTCNGISDGRITADVTGGTPPYTYTWTPAEGTNATASNLSAGTYTILVEDAICNTAQVAVTITQPTILNSTVGVSTYPLCNGGKGSATVGATGGTIPYKYAWSPIVSTTTTVTGLSAGIYTTTVTDKNGCISTEVVTITQPAALTASIALPAYPLCNGDKGSATVSVTGGTGTYTYSWSHSGGNGAIGTSLTIGTYTVTVKDNHGCLSTASVTITQPIELTASIGVPTYPLCNGSIGNAFVSATGGTGIYTYSWSPAGGNSTIGTGLTAGTYTATVTDNNGCITSASVIITQPALLSAVTSFTPASCNLPKGSATINTTGGAIPYTYLWSSLTSGQSTATATGLSTGTYSVQVTDKNGCTITETVTITQPSGVIVTINGSTATSCNGGNNGSATSSVSGGTTPYTYLWSNGAGTNANASGLSAGTYTLSVTDNNGCMDAATITITQPIYSLSVNTTVTSNVSCKSLSDGNASSSLSGGTMPYTYSWSSGAGTNANASGLSAGTYTLIVTDANGCFTSAAVTITQPAFNLNIIATTTENVSCKGLSNGSVISSVSGGTVPYTYTWSNGAGTNANASGLSAGTYTLTVTDANGCITNTVVAITQPLYGLSAIAMATENVSCNGLSNGIAISNVSGGTAPYTYSWSGGAGTNANASGLSAGTYTLSATDANGCFTNTATVIITQPAFSLSAIATAIENVSCNGSNNGSAASGVSGGTAPYTYLWSEGAGTNANASGLSAGTYILVVTDANGCTINTTVTITQPLFSLNATIATTQNVSCNGLNNGSITSSISGGTAPYTYSWSSGAGTNANASGLSAGTYTLTIIDANGCTTSTTATITQPAFSLSATTFATENVSCNGLNNGSASSNVSGGTAPYTYSWSSGAGTNANTTDLSAGTYSLTVMDVNGCSASSVITITQPIKLTAKTSFTQASCNLNNGSAMVSAVGGTSPYTYLWNPSAQTTATITGISAGIYTATIIDNNGCSISSVVTITQPSAVVAAILTSTGVSCNGGSNGTATAGASGGTAPYIYVWSPGGNTNAEGTGLSTGTFTITVSDANGCQATTSIIITQPPLVTGDFMGTPMYPLCNGGTGSAVVTATGGEGAYTYSWMPSGGSTAKGTGLMAGTYTVIITDNNGCTPTGTLTINITQPPLLVTTMGTPKNSDCNKPTGSVAVSVTGGTGAYTYFWEPTGDTTATGTGLSAGTYIVIVTDNNGCIATNSATISIPIPVINVCCPATIIQGKDTTLVVSGVGDSINTWEPQVTCLNHSCDTVKVAPTVTTTYTVTALDSSGCPVEKYITVEVEIPCFNPTIPNVFTPTNPGSSGLDNIFYIKTTNLDSWSILIYDRWGVELFNTTNPYQYWNGNTKSGGEAPAGVYYYTIKATCQGNTYEKAGFLQLIR